MTYNRREIMKGLEKALKEKPTVTEVERGEYSLKYKPERTPMDYDKKEFEKKETSRGTPMFYCKECYGMGAFDPKNVTHERHCPNKDDD